MNGKVVFTAALNFKLFVSCDWACKAYYVESN